MRTPSALLAIAFLAACGDGASNEGGNRVSEDPYGASGSPGADMTDNGAPDGSNGLADGNAAR